MSKTPKRTTPEDKAIGERIRKRRKELKISQEGLGKIVGVSFQQVQKYENGTNRVSASRLSKIADHLQVPVTMLLGEGDLGVGHPTKKSLTRSVDALVTAALNIQAQVKQLQAAA
jgi:transcriptional regulator with XRE-family HTH domain